jgi:CDP-6-deoxy-D-xylo-4-hexulose-3-dehydrase
MGDKVRRFEKLFAKYIGVKYALMVNSGSSANLLELSIL